MFEDNTLSSLIKNQFPLIYKEEGDNLIIFLKNYYKFLESNYLDKTFKLKSYSDIDTTIDAYINNIIDEYMSSIPENIVADRKLLQKHILDLYRSKGSSTAISLLFKILYNEEIDIYIPETDIFKASSGNWVIPEFIEIEYKSSNVLLQDQLITGVTTESTAIVSSYVVKNIGGKKYSILYIENISGQFEVDELINCSTFTTQSMRPLILGSPQNLDVISSSPNFSLGEILKPLNSLTIHDEILRIKVSKLKDVDSGIIVPQIIYGGNGYSVNATITITDNTNISGVGFDFEIATLTNTSNLYTSNVAISSYATTPLDANNYGFPNTAIANVNSVISSALGFYNIEIGSINTLRVINPGVNYDGLIDIIIHEPALDGYEIIDYTTGLIWGNNANIYGPATYGVNAIASVSIINSGLGYTNNEIITFQTLNDINKISSISINLDYLGVEAGSHLDDNGFLSSQKKLRDSYYYQEFSYEIRSSKTIIRYIDVLKKLVHPAGNEVFGKYLFKG